jgi:hypothetical protein
MINNLQWYCHMSSEIIHIVAYDTYDGFQHLENENL